MARSSWWEEVKKGEADLAPEYPQPGRWTFALEGTQGRQCGSWEVRGQG